MWVSIFATLANERFSPISGRTEGIILLRGQIKDCANDALCRGSWSYRAPERMTVGVWNSGSMLRAALSALTDGVGVWEGRSHSLTSQAITT